MRALSILVADDIRYEMSGKLVMTGVYSGNMVISPDAKLPVLLPQLWILIRVRLEGGDSTPNKVRLSLSVAGERMFSIDGSELTVDKPGEPIVMTFHIQPFAVTKLGEHLFDVELLRDEEVLFSMRDGLHVVEGGVSPSGPRIGRSTSRT